MEYLIGFIVAGALFIALILIFKSKLFSRDPQEDEAMMQRMEMQIKSMIPEILNQSNETLVRLANEKLGAEKKEIKTDMENKRSELERMMKVVIEDLHKRQKELDSFEKERASDFSSLREKLEEQKKITEQLRVTADGLKEILSSNPMRGQFGEQVAEDLLRMSGFVKGVDYEYNRAQAGSATTRPDFSIKLPDGTRINVDVKFPYANLQKMTETEDEGQKATYMKQFERDVKEKIKQCTTRDYINVDDKTVDFVILFIPNEMIFSFIYENYHEVWQDAMRNKVILAGPFSFTAILRMVRQAYENFRYQSNIREIIGHVREFEKQFGKFNEEFTKIGRKITELENQYNTVANTRTNVLLKSVERVQLEGKEVEDDQPRLLDDVS